MSMKSRYCTQFRLVLMKQETGKITLSRARCKKWSCPYCSELNAYQWRSRLRFALHTTPGTWQFITYTAHRHWRGEARSLKNIRENSGKLWKRWVRLAKKTTDEKLLYVRLFEAHKDGSVHVHGFVRAPMGIYPQASGKIPEKRTQDDYNGIRWLKTASRECGMGFQADVTEITDRKKSVHYVTKYMSKSLFSLELPKGARRIQTSHGFPKPDWMQRGGGGDWEVLKHGMPTSVVESYLRRGFEVYDLDLRKSLSYDDTNDMGEYWGAIDDTAPG